jgi:hypothetical protein
MPLRRRELLHVWRGKAVYLETIPLFQELFLDEFDDPRGVVDIEERHIE